MAISKSYSKLDKKYIDILKSGKISESELTSLKTHVNSSKPAYAVKQEILDLVYNGINLSKEQQQKGIDWLIKQYKTPTGKLKETHPYGTREISILENWKEVYLSGLENLSLFGTNYQPVFAVKDKYNNRFEYSLSGGKLNIIS